MQFKLKSSPMYLVFFKRFNFGYEYGQILEKVLPSEKVISDDIKSDLFNFNLS